MWQGAAYVTVLGRDATIGRGISGPVLDMANWQTWDGG